ncbi:MAG: hypothetical protein JXR94_20600 [Candidatus Hydrogenedentes bacterium]|nr:hypothetical protein [Candidatus Hydrogenedentota bacterium]
MSDSPFQNGKQAEDIRQIPRWTRRYAMNRRSFGVALNIGVFLFLFGVIKGFSHLSGVAHRAGETFLSYLLFAPALIACVVVCVGSIYLSVPKWGGRKLEGLLKRLEGRGGSATLSVPGNTKKRRWDMLVAGGLFACCIVACVCLGSLGYIPSTYMQPVSALYSVPFLLFLAYRLWPIAGPIPLLWPLLYSVHAVLILAGAPILFTGSWEGLNILIPVGGYGMLTSLIGFAYSRYALRRLKRLARIEGGENGPETQAIDADES